jgi:hypothetical protein
VCVCVCVCVHPRRPQRQRQPACVRMARNTAMHAARVSCVGVCMKEGREKGT